jgi:hypothetical protein
MVADDTRKPVLSEVEWMRRGNVTVIIPNPHEGEIGGGLTRLLRHAVGIRAVCCPAVSR